MNLLRKSIIALYLLLTFAVGFSAFDSFFINSTMRVDFHHSGTAKSDYYGIDQIYQEGEWPGSRISLIDTLNRGQYLLKIYNLRTNQLIYSRGFGSIFYEWQTTDEARSGMFKTVHETVRFPLPIEKIKLVIAKRDKSNQFVDQFSYEIDPNSYAIHREEIKSSYQIRTFLRNGDPGKKIDILVLGDGFTQDELNKFHQHVERYTNSLFKTTPFDKRKNDFNVWAIDVISIDTGIDEPRLNRWKNTALGTSFNSFDSPRYVLTTENKAVRDIAGAAPYDFICILLNSSRYGGGGIYNLFATSYTGSQDPFPDWWSDYVFVHEFGHLFAGLADEYYTSSVAYNDFFQQGVEPWEPNVTALLNPQQPKWSKSVRPGTPIPTAWGKAAYDSLSYAMQQLDKEAENYREKYEQLFNEMKTMLEKEPYSGQVGCFEGAGYASKGLYRPYLDCRMFSKSLAPFCPICQSAIEEMIDFLTR